MLSSQVEDLTSLCIFKDYIDNDVLTISRNKSEQERMGGSKRGASLLSP